MPRSETWAGCPCHVAAGSPRHPPLRKKRSPSSRRLSILKRGGRGTGEGAEGCGAERHSDKPGLAGAGVVSGTPAGAYRRIPRTGPEPPLNGGGKAANRANLRLAPVLAGPHDGRNCKEMGSYGSKAGEAPGKKREKAQQAETAAPILTQAVQLQSLIAALGAAS